MVEKWLVVWQFEECFHLKYLWINNLKSVNKMIFNTTISVQSLVFLVSMQNHCYQVGIKEVVQLVLESMVQASHLK